MREMMETLAREARAMAYGRDERESAVRLVAAAERLARAAREALQKDDET